MPSTDQPIRYIVDHSILDVVVKGDISGQTQPISPDLCHPQLRLSLDPFSRLVVAATFDIRTVHPPCSTNDLQKEGS